MEYDADCLTEKKGSLRHIPALDVKIHVGDGVENSKAFTLSAISALIDMNINRDNYKLVKAYIELIGLPMRKELCGYLDERYGDSSVELPEELKGVLYEGKV